LEVKIAIFAAIITALVFYGKSVNDRTAKDISSKESIFGK